jgi:phage gp45-like
MVIVATDSHDYRPTGGLLGETCMYTMHGHIIKLAQDGSIAITTPEGAGKVTITGNLEVTGTSTFQGSVSMMSTLDVLGKLTVTAAIEALSVAAGTVGAFVRLLTHVHPGIGQPPTPGP